MATRIDPSTKSKCLALLRKGESPKEIADRYGLNPATLRSWKRDAEDGGEPMPRLAAARKVRAPKGEQAVPPALPAVPELPEDARKGVFIRLGSLASLKIPARIRQLAERSASPESQVTRSLLLLGLMAAERDLGTLSRAAEIARGMAA